MRWIAIFATLALVPALARAEEQESAAQAGAGGGYGGGAMWRLP